MLTRVELTNFKNHRHSTLWGLGSITLLCGPNGAGKSSVLAALHALSFVRQEPPSQVFVGESAHEHVARRGCSEWSLSATGGEPSWQATITATQREHGGWVSELRLGLDDGQEPEPAEYQENRLEAPASFLEFLRGIHYFRFQPDRLAAPSPPRIPPRIGVDGEGLASVVAFLAQSWPDAYQRLNEMIAKVVPSVKRVRTSLKRLGPTRGSPEGIIGNELLYDTLSGDGIPAHAQSDGTNIAVALLAAIQLDDAERPDHPSLFLLDDLETALHPVAQRHLMDLMHSLVERHPRMQIIATTHSPYLIDSVEGESVWVLESTNGIANARRLTDHPDAHTGLRLLSTGEFWSSTGEGWTADVEVGG